MGISVQAFTDSNPCPRVEVTVTGLHATTESLVTVWRTAGGQRLRVQGADREPATAAFTIVDYAAPLAQEIEYVLEVVGPAPTAPLTDSVTVASAFSWLQNPLAPSESTPLTGSSTGSVGAKIRGSALAEFTYPMPVEIVRVLGSAYPVALGSTRGAAASVPFDLFCDTAEATSAVRSILVSSFPVLFRPLPGLAPMPPVAFLSIESISEQPIDTFIGGTMTRWSLKADVVQGPAISIVIPVWTYGDVSALWATYATAAATGKTYLQFQQDPEP